MTDFATHLKSYDCHLVEAMTTHETLVERDRELASDTHLCRYLEEGQERMSAIRAFKQSDIFDALHDRGFKVLEIVSGYGRIKPKLFGYQAPASKPKK